MSTDVARPEAAELTQEEFQARVDEAHRLETDIKVALRAGKQAMWDLAKAAYEFKEAQGWSALGYEKLVDWLADPDISMTRSTFYRLHQSYYDTVVQRQIPEQVIREVDQSKLQVVLPKVKASKVSIEEALQDCATMGWADLREEYVMRPKNPSTGTTEGDEPGEEPSGVGDGEVIDTTAEPVAASDVHTPDGYWETREGAETVQSPDDPPGWPDDKRQVDWEMIDTAVAYANEVLAMPVRTGEQRRLDKDVVQKLQTALEQLVDAITGQA